MHAKPLMEQKPREDEALLLRLTRAEAELLEAHLSRAVARIEDELVENQGAGTTLATHARDLRHLERRLRDLLAQEPIADLV